MSNDILKRQGITTRTGTDIINLSVTSTPFVVDGYVPRGCVTVMSGEGGSRKSFLTEHLAVCVINGIDWFGQEVQQGPVLLLDLENTAEYDLKPRLTTLAEGLRLEGHTVSLDDLIIPDMPRGLHLDTDDGIEALDALCEACRPVLVLIDSLGDFVSARFDTNSADHMFALVNGLDMVLRRYHAAALVLHHQRKLGPGNNDSGQRLRGTAGLRDAVRSHMAVSRRAGDIIRLEHEKRNRGQDTLEDAYLAVERSAEATIIRRTQKPARVNAKADKVAAELLAVLSSVPMTRAAVMAELQERTDASESTIDKKMKMLVTEGRAIQDKNGWALAGPRIELAA